MTHVMELAEKNHNCYYNYITYVQEARRKIKPVT